MTKARNRVRVPIGKELAKIRIDMDETAAAMCKRLDIHSTYLSRIEVGSYPLTLAVARKIQEVYGRDFFGMVSKEVTGKMVFNMGRLSDEDRNTIMEIYRRNTPVEADSTPESADLTKVVIEAPAVSSGATPDVDGVDFVGEDELDELGDLDD